MDNLDGEIWIRVSVIDDDYSDTIADWCVQNIGLHSIDWYVGTGPTWQDLIYRFRHEEDATAFKLRFGL